MQERSQQEVLVLTALPLKGVEDIQRVALVLYHHGPEQPLLRRRQVVRDHLSLCRVYARP
jgi:hypothetical protein